MALSGMLKGYASAVPVSGPIDLADEEESKSLGKDLSIDLDEKQIELETAVTKRKEDVINK